MFSASWKAFNTPFLYSFLDFRTIPDKYHKNIVRMLKGKLFCKLDISVTVQVVTEKAKNEGKLWFVVNVGTTDFSTVTMRFRIVAFALVSRVCRRFVKGFTFKFLL